MQTVNMHEGELNFRKMEKRMKVWYQRAKLIYLMSYGVTTLPFVLLFWNVTAMQIIAWANLFETLVLTYVFLKLFFLMKNRHNFEFKRH
jgi:hypothetical protein